MEEKFGEFFLDKNYIKVKNSLFNYKNRKNQIEAVFNKYYKNETHLLDIGSGISPVAPSNLLKKTLFMDLSKEGINFLKKQGLNAEQGNITKTHFKKNNFDWIFCSEVLEHTKDYKKAIKELYRITKKKGKVMITVPVHKKYWHSDDEFVEHYRRFNPKILRKDIENAGFEIMEEKPIGSIIERYLTLLIVKAFKSRKDKEINKLFAPLFVLINNILYFIVKLSLITASKKSTSIMLYLCRKN